MSPHRNSRVSHYTNLRSETHGIAVFSCLKRLDYQKNFQLEKHATPTLDGAELSEKKGSRVWHMFGRHNHILYCSLIPQN